MLELTDINGRAHYIAADNICRITDAGASSQWHGIRSFVKLFDGTTLECQQDAKTVATRVAAEQFIIKGGE